MKSKLVLISALASALLFIAATIDLSNPDNYASQPKPAYITKDNTTAGNAITDKGATLGRILFYDKRLSQNETVSCGSCHKQQFAFGDTALLSKGLFGANTGRHAMRLINSRFGTEVKFFWDERAATLEDQSTSPIKDHNEMGYSGANGDPDIDSLIRKMNTVWYYKPLFTHVFGDSVITEPRMRRALAQFMRSIQSFDSKFDTGRALVANDAAPFPNYTQQENDGKQIFLAPPPQGGAGCQGCHRAPEFDIDPQSGNNGVIAIAGTTVGTDFTNTRAPSLRDVFNPSGNLNTPLMHTGGFNNMLAVINHYDQITVTPGNTNLDNRLLGPGGQGQTLNLTQQQKASLVAFLKTLTGSNVYTDPKWSDPFDNTGNINITGLTAIIPTSVALQVNAYPNPATKQIHLELPASNYSLRILSHNGQQLAAQTLSGSTNLNLEAYPSGILLLEIIDTDKHLRQVVRIVKR